MTLSRSIVSDGLLGELDQFAELIRDLSDEQWSTPSRCAGWTVGNVAAHLVGTMTSVTLGNFDGLGTPEVTQREVDERIGLSAKQLAEECEQSREALASLLAIFDDTTWEGPAPEGVSGTLGSGTEALLYDAYLHTDDVRSALGLTPQYGAGLAAAVSYVIDQLLERGWDGDAPGGEEAAHEFVLVATGRRPAGPDGPPNIYAE